MVVFTLGSLLGPMVFQAEDINVSGTKLIYTGRITTARTVWYPYHNPHIRKTSSATYIRFILALNIPKATP